MRGRFWISTVTRRVGASNTDEPHIYGEVELNAVQRQNPDDNTNWAHYTPVGKLTMTVHPEAREWFEAHQGEDVYLDLTPIPRDADA